MHEAREIVRTATRCAAGQDKVIFTGSGATAGVNLLLTMLGLTPNSNESSIPQPEASQPVIFVGPFEHHSNILPWRDSGADVVAIRLSADGCGPDLSHLEEKLIQYKERPLRIGAFSAASNVTGALTDTNEVTRICHRHGALAVWDYASAAPHGLPDMNPPAANAVEAAAIAKDAAFWSMHKFAGGPQAPGETAMRPYA
jgi:selenocysteine lyase/cysteine desulfurase